MNKVATHQKVNPNIRTVLLQVVCDASGKEFSFTQNEQIAKAARIVEIEAFSVAQIPISLTGQTVVNATVFAKSFLVLKNTSGVEYRTLPLEKLQITAARQNLLQVNTPAIDLQQTKVVVGSPANLAAGEVFLFAITYEIAG